MCIKNGSHYKGLNKKKQNLSIKETNTPNTKKHTEIHLLNGQRKARTQIYADLHQSIAFRRKAASLIVQR